MLRGSEALGRRAAPFNPRRPPTGTGACEGATTGFGMA